MCPGCRHQGPNRLRSTRRALCPGCPTGRSMWPIASVRGRTKRRRTLPEARAAAVHPGTGSFTWEDVRLEEPRNDEVLVRVVGAGICHTDLASRDEHLHTPLPAVLGHEGSGVVEAVGEGVTHV